MTLTVPQIEKVVYTGKTRTIGGRDGGSARSSDGRLDIKLSTPGGPGEGTNPEQLLAAGWSACYLSAIKIVAAKLKYRLPPETAIETEVDLGTTDGQYFLQARLFVRLPGTDPATAQQLADAAHLQCPYSKALHGSINITTTVVTA